MTDVKLYTFSGTNHEIGFQQGKANRQQIQEALERIPNYEFVKSTKPRILPTSLFMRMAKRRAARMLGHDILECYPKEAERMVGLAEGAGTDLTSILFLQATELLIGNPTYRIEACTTLALGPSCTTTAETIVGKNFDYLNVLEPYQLACETKPKEGYATLGCKMGPLPGMLDGMNEHGLTVTYNLAYTLDEAKWYAPLSMALQEMLETCKDTDEAARFIAQAKRGGHDAVLTLADAEGSIKTVEITSNHSTTSITKDGQTVNTNHFKSDEMQRYEIPHSAIYFGKGVPREYLGVRVHESTERRLERAQELLGDGKEKVDENRVISILRDHGKDNKPSMTTICRHDNFASTLRSVIFYPNQETMKALYGKPCQEHYHEFKFS